MNNLGTVVHKQADDVHAQVCYEQTVALSYDIDDLQSRREAHNQLGHLLVDQAQLPSARLHHETALNLPIHQQILAAFQLGQRQKPSLPPL